MSEEQLSAFFEAAKADAGLEEILKGASDLDAVLAIAVETGFNVSKEDLLKAQAQNALEMSDEDLAEVAGGSPTEAIVKDWLAALKNMVG
jgi:predicted ribosomally synthesized peptide with nif11-like leader